MPAPIDFYFWTTPNGWKIAIALEEFGLPYSLHLVNLDKGEQFSPEYTKIAPSNKMPAIVDPAGPDGAPIAIFESGAILQYLARKTGQFYGTTEREHIVVDQWLMWQMGQLGPLAGQAHHFLRYAPAMDPPQIIAYAQNRYREACRKLYAMLDRRFAEVEFVAGDFYSIADIAILPWIKRHRRQEQRLEDTPDLLRWYNQMRAPRRPARLCPGGGTHIKP